MRILQFADQQAIIRCTRRHCQLTKLLGAEVRGYFKFDKIQRSCRTPSSMNQDNGCLPDRTLVLCLVLEAIATETSQVGIKVLRKEVHWKLHSLCGS